jgi:hypothetical protein
LPAKNDNAIYQADRIDPFAGKSDRRTARSYSEGVSGVTA